jgi:HSP20 family protein
MTQLVKKRSDGNGSLFSSRRNSFFPDRFFSPILSDFGNEFFGENLDIPPANITETDKMFRLDLSAPGLEKSDFKIDIENATLIISGEREETKEDKNYRRREFSYNNFCRTFQLPDNIDENNITAKYDNGMLQLTIPKKEVSISKQKKQITVS